MGVDHYDCSADAVQKRGTSALADILSPDLIAQSIEKICALNGSDI